jgi:microcystin-dependent protein
MTHFINYKYIIFIFIIILIFIILLIYNNKNQINNKQQNTIKLYDTNNPTSFLLTDNNGNLSISSTTLQDLQNLITTTKNDLKNSIDDYLPKGTIIAWYPVSVSTAPPNGWAVCDGTNGTPDLRGRFIMGYSTSRAYKSTGGEERVTLKLTEIPPHQHETGGHTASNMLGDVLYPYIVDAGRRGAWSYYAGGNPNGNEKGLTDSHENMPPYVAVIYIMKTN